MSEKTPRRKFKDLSAPVLADPVRRERVKQQVHAIHEVLALAQVREVRQLTQTEVAKNMKVTQANISRVEHEDDVYLSTLRGYVAALGGQLEIQAVFPEETIQLDVTG